MGYRNPRGTTGIHPMILGFDCEWFENDGFDYPNPFMPPEDILSFQECLNGEEETPDQGEDLGGNWDCCMSDYHADKLHEWNVGEFIEDCCRLGLRWREVTTDEYVAALVAADYAPISDNSLATIRIPSAQSGSSSMRQGRYSFPLMDDWNIDLDERARQPQRKGKPGRTTKTSERSREWKPRQHSSTTPMADATIEHENVLIEYPHCEARKIRTEQYYHDLLRNCRFSLAEYAGEGDEHFWDEDRFDEPAARREREEIEAAWSEQMLEHHKLKTKEHRLPSWRSGSLWDLADDFYCNPYDNHHPYDGELGIFEDYLGPDNPNFVPCLDDAAWAEIDRLNEERARDRDPAPAFGGSSRYHLRARNPRGNRERYVA